METIKYEVEGLKETLEMIDVLPAEIEKKVIVSVLGSNANTYIVKPIKVLYSSFSSAVQYKYKGRLYYLYPLKGVRTIIHKHGSIGVKTGLVGRVPFLIRWEDAGTKIRTTKKGANRGQIKAKNQIEPLIDRQIAPMVKNIEENFSNDCNKIVERLTRKINKTLL